MIVNIPTLKYGDILKADDDIIVHQVNCLGLMGAGLALQIKDTYPNVFDAYRKFVELHNTSELLGKNLITTTDGRVPDTSRYAPDVKYVSNIFAQLNIGRGTRQTDYQAFEKGLVELYDFATSNELTVAIPYGIGCGLAGGEWSVIHRVISSVFHDYPVTIYKLN